MSIEFGEIVDKLDQIIGLLKIVAKDEIDERRKILLSTPAKQQIYELCDGSNDLMTISKKIKISHEYVRLTVRDLVSDGFVVMNREGSKRFPLKII